jgi:hypothetical protein
MQAFANSTVIGYAGQQQPHLPAALVEVKVAFQGTCRPHARLNAAAPTSLVESLQQRECKRVVQRVTAASSSMSDAWIAAGTRASSPGDQHH